VKFYRDPDQARAEVAALTLYRAAGLDTLEPRLVERPDPAGNRRVALATAWRDDLEPLRTADVPAHAEELRRIYAVSALVANWDVAGATLDNLARTASGRLVVLDAGGSFTFRAQGGAKPFERDQVPELQSLRSPLVNRSAASVFNPALDADVFAEASSARAVLDALARSQAFEAAMVAGNVPAALAGAWRGALVGRAALMRDRYDLERTYLPEQAAPYLDELRDLFAGNLAAWSARRELDGGHRVADDFAAQAPAMVATFEEWARKRFPGLARSGRSGTKRDAVSLLRSMFRRWSGSSSSDQGAALKAWAASRFARHGAAITYHGTPGAEGARLAAERFATWLRETGLERDQVFAVLDAEYAFNQVLLRRAHGWDVFPLHRYMREAEYRSGVSRGRFRANAAASWTARRGAFAGDRLVTAEFRAEWVLKVWQQGAEYMHYQGKEAEYVGIGALLRILGP
jgi:hypothetical protein